MDLVKFILGFMIGQAAVENPRTSGKIGCFCCAVVLVVFVAFVGISFYMMWEGQTRTGQI